MKQLERQREEEQLERARVINALTQRLEESQQQCAKLLHTSEQRVEYRHQPHVFLLKYLIKPVLEGNHRTVLRNVYF